MIRVTSYLFFANILIQEFYFSTNLSFLNATTLFCMVQGNILIIKLI